MMNFKKLLTGPQAINKKLIIVLAVLCLVGFVDATYITVKHYSGGPLPCSIVNGCDTVVNSRFSSILGIPVALIGAAFYLINLILLLAHFDTGKAHFIKFLHKMVWAGFIATLWFLFLQFFIIKALCFYCLVSAVVSVTLFIGVVASD